MKLPERLPTKLILISAALIVAGAGATFMTQQLKPTQKPAKSVHFKVVQPEAPAEEVTPETVSGAPVAPVAGESTVDPSAQTNSSTAPAVQPTYRFAAEMAAAGIAQSDYGFVTELVLDQNGWRLFQRDPNLPIWHLARQTRGDLASQLGQVNLYVQVTYGGSWSAAHDTYVQTRNF